MYRIRIEEERGKYKRVKKGVTSRKHPDWEMKIFQDIMDYLGKQTWVYATREEARQRLNILSGTVASPYFELRDPAYGVQLASEEIPGVKAPYVQGNVEYYLDLAELYRTHKWSILEYYAPEAIYYNKLRGLNIVIEYTDKANV